MPTDHLLNRRARLGCQEFQSCRTYICSQDACRTPSSGDKTLLRAARMPRYRGERCMPNTLSCIWSFALLLSLYHMQQAFAAGHACCLVRDSAAVAAAALWLLGGGWCSISPEPTVHSYDSRWLCFVCCRCQEASVPSPSILCRCLTIVASSRYLHYYF